MSVVKQFYQGKTRDFVVFIEEPGLAAKYLKDSTIPLSEVVGKFKVYTEESGRGSQGQLSEASKQELSSEFGDLKIEEIIDLIIKKGVSKNDPEINKNSWTSTNDSHFGH